MRRVTAENARLLQGYLRSMLAAMLGEGKEGGGMGWRLLKRLRRLNVGGCLSAVINAGGDGATATKEQREEIRTLKNLVEENYIYAQREYGFWKEIVQVQEDRLVRIEQGVNTGGQGLNEENQSDSEQDSSRETGSGDTEQAAQQQGGQGMSQDTRQGGSDVIEV